MNLLKETDFSWHADQPDAPNKTASQMKDFMDAPIRTLVQKVNEIIGEGEALSVGELTAMLKECRELVDALWEDSAQYNETVSEALNDLRVGLMLMEQELKTKQQQMTAGQNIVIENNVISSNFDGELHNALRVQEGTGFKLQGDMPYIDGVAAADGFVSAGDIAASVRCTKELSPDVYVLNHFDLSEAELQEVVTQCYENKKPLVCEVGSMRYVCPQVYKTTAGLLVFIYVGCSAEGEVLFKRFAYNPTRLNEDGTVYHSEKEFRTDHVIEIGTDGVWNYRKWSNGRYDAYCDYTTEETYSITKETKHGYTLTQSNFTLAYPSFHKGMLFGCNNSSFIDTTYPAVSSNVWGWSTCQFTLYAAEAISAKIRVMIKVEGTWK